MPVAIVTGGSRGIGKAIVERLTALGWSVTFCYAANDTAATALSQATGAVAVRADVADKAAINALASEVVARHGKIDLLVNNAAVSYTGLFNDITDAQWQSMRAVNIDGVINSTAAVLPFMIAAHSGRIVNISSVWGMVGASCEVHYSTTKAAVIGFTRSLAKEVGPSGITVNCIAPGVIDTDMNLHLTDADISQLEAETPLCRIGKPEEIAGTVTFLAGEEAAFITGQVIAVDGGFAL